MEYIVDTLCGKVKGIKCCDGIVAYKGIRYATAKRFEYPEIVTKWEGIYDATNFGSCSYQPRSFYDEELNLKKVFYYHEFRKGKTFTYSEDCLFLNIYTPEVIDEKMPVLVCIHGGGFTGGCGHELHFDTPIWPKKGVIGVTINYRLGPLGFACFDNHDGKCNFGLYDQLTAFQWIKNNISAFGGDPDNVTVMGQSAGAMSLQQHVLSPLAKDLFQKAMMCSGGGVSRMLVTPKASKRYQFWGNVMKNASCNSVLELQSVDIEKLFEAYEKTRIEMKIKAMICSPVIDNKLVIGDSYKLFKAKKHAKIPYLIGSTSEDIIPPIIHDMSKKWALKQEVASYCFMFDHQLPGDQNGAWHSSDLWYWFGTLDNCWRPMTEDDYELSNVMTTYLTNFVKTGNPNGENLPKWKKMCKCHNTVMHLGNGFVGMKKVKVGKLWNNMLTKKAVGE